jgi:hypothetical protein
MDELEQFIKNQHGLQDMSLCIAIEQSVDSLVKLFEEGGFIATKDVSSISGSGNYVLPIDNTNVSEVYNLAAQYGSGQWGPIDGKWVDPKYDDLAVVGVIAKDFLEALEQKNIPLLSKVGMTIQQ